MAPRINVDAVIARSPLSLLYLLQSVKQGAGKQETKKKAQPLSYASS